MCHKILVIEDDEFWRDYLVKALEREGVSSEYELTFAKDSDEAIEILNREDFDIVLLDIILPVKLTDSNTKEGIELCKKIKDTKGEKLAIIGVTIRASEVAKEELMRAGARDYVTKPFDSGDLIERIGKVISRFSETRKED